jgi:ubiquinone/menaquinone biosynthesis C-methylase UbiE
MMNEDKLKRMLSPERMSRIDGEILIERMNLADGQTVADAGTGPGAFAFRFADALPHGKVYAVDIDVSLLELIQARAAEAGIENIQTVNALKLDIPSESLDKVFCCTVLHEVAEKEAFILAYYRLLKPSGRIYIAEFSSGRRSLDEDDTARRTFIAPERTEQLLTTAGFGSVSTEVINPLIYLTTAEKPEV